MFTCDRALALRAFRLQSKDIRLKDLLDIPPETQLAKLLAVNIKRRYPVLAKPILSFQLSVSQVNAFRNGLKNIK